MSFRLSSAALRLQRLFPALVLMLGLVRTPVLRSLGASTLSLGVRGGALWALYPVFAVAGFLAVPVDALAGSTQLATTPAQPLQFKVGKPVEIRFKLINTVTDAKSYRVSGKLPPGLAFVDLDQSIVNDPEGIIRGTPTKPGTYTVGIVGCEDYNGYGRRKRESLVIKVVRE